MNRLEIIQRFRAENPEITERVKNDTVLNSWLLEGNLNFATAAKLIPKVDTFTSSINEDEYNLTTYFSDFIEVNEFPGGGVAYAGKRLDLTSRAEHDRKSRSWRSRASGTPKKYYRQGELLIFDRPCEDAQTVTVDYYARPDDFNDDNIEPFNQMVSLKPYHYGLVLYLQGRAKMAVGKDQDKLTAMVEYEQYVKWCAKQVRGGRSSTIQYAPADTNRSFGTYRRYQR